jgi:hypothetical protein
MEVRPVGADPSSTTETSYPKKIWDTTIWVVKGLWQATVWLIKGFCYLFLYLPYVWISHKLESISAKCQRSIQSDHWENEIKEILWEPIRNNASPHDLGLIVFNLLEQSIKTECSITFKTETRDEVRTKKGYRTEKVFDLIWELQETTFRGSRYKSFEGFDFLSESQVSTLLQMFDNPSIFTEKRISQDHSPTYYLDKYFPRLFPKNYLYYAAFPKKMAIINNRVNHCASLKFQDLCLEKAFQSHFIPLRELKIVQSDRWQEELKMYFGETLDQQEELPRRVFSILIASFDSSHRTIAIHKYILHLQVNGLDERVFPGYDCLSLEQMNEMIQKLFDSQLITNPNAALAGEPEVHLASYLRFLLPRSHFLSLEKKDLVEKRFAYLQKMQLKNLQETTYLEKALELIKEDTFFSPTPKELENIKEFQKKRRNFFNEFFVNFCDKVHDKTKTETLKNLIQLIYDEESFEALSHQKLIEILTDLFAATCTQIPQWKVFELRALCVSLFIPTSDEGLKKQAQKRFTDLKKSPLFETEFPSFFKGSLHLFPDENLLRELDDNQKQKINEILLAFAKTHQLHTLVELDKEDQEEAKETIKEHLKELIVLFTSYRSLRTRNLKQASFKDTAEERIALWDKARDAFKWLELLSGAISWKSYDLDQNHITTISGLNQLLIRTKIKDTSKTHSQNPESHSQPNTPTGSISGDSQDSDSPKPGISRRTSRKNSSSRKNSRIENIMSQPSSPHKEAQSKKRKSRGSKSKIPSFKSFRVIKNPGVILERPKFFQDRNQEEEEKKSSDAPEVKTSEDTAKTSSQSKPSFELPEPSNEILWKSLKSLLREVLDENTII